MKNLSFVIVTTLATLTGCASNLSTQEHMHAPSNTQASAINMNGLSLVQENTERLNIGGINYHLKTYIKPFQQPYYVKVERADGESIEKHVAKKVALQYIRPRGCTQNPEYAPNLDQHDTNKTKWIIGVVC